MFLLRGEFHCSPPMVARPWKGKKLVQHVSRFKKKTLYVPSLLVQYHPSVEETPLPNRVRKEKKKRARENLVTSHVLDCFPGILPEDTTIPIEKY